MTSDLRDFVMNHALFCHHDHHHSFKAFEENRSEYDAKSLLGYARADLETAAGTASDGHADGDEAIARLWPKIRTTGYGRAVSLGCRRLFDLEYSPENFDQITERLRAVFMGKSACEVYDYFVREKANNRWVIQDHHFQPGNEDLLQDETYPDYYRFSWRMDDLFSIVDASPVQRLERTTGMSVSSLGDLVQAMHANIDRFIATGKFAAFKLGIAYKRDLVIGDPSPRKAEMAFDRILDRKPSQDATQQNTEAPNASETRPLADYMIHRLLERAGDEDIPVQVHTGYLAGNWGALAGTKALHLLPVFEKYRRVRFDVFHASWPWSSELAAIAKNYPNLYPDMCWVWAMNPSESERTLAEWLDAVPFNKIFAFGADTELPWCNAGYSIQARLGIVSVLEEKIRKGFFSDASAREVASAIMLANGERFHGLS